MLASKHPGLQAALKHCTKTLASTLQHQQQPANIIVLLGFCPQTCKYLIHLVSELRSLLSLQQKLNNNQNRNIGALKIRIGLWGPLYYTYNNEPPQNGIGSYFGLYTKPHKSL